MALQQPICGVNPEGLYVLWEPYVYRFGGQDIAVPEGFVWDGASVPRGLWTISGIRKDGRIRAAALIHDFLYRNLGQATDALCFSRKGADKLFYTIMREAGMSWWRASRAYRAVRVFGWIAWRKHARNRQRGK